MEAGGVLTDFKGEGFDMNMSECLASNGLIHKEMLDVLMKGVSKN
ncbi:MAG: inositol monophosphatase, partial [Deltaproteobacteria bacterium]|nr:inositol monophosphatase [Deltaproteobacteria bacterium]